MDDTLLRISMEPFAADPDGEGCDDEFWAYELAALSREASGLLTNIFSKKLSLSSVNLAPGPI